MEVEIHMLADRHLWLNRTKSEREVPGSRQLDCGRKRISVRWPLGRAMPFMILLEQYFCINQESYV